MFKKMNNLLKLAKIYEMKVVYLDEAVFTFNTFNTKAWSVPMIVSRSMNRTYV